ncbi:MAG: flagellar FliJ family protein [Actinomycetota bacterium]
MKKYTFSLAKVLRVRRIEEEQAAARLAAARSAAAAAAAKEVGATHALASRCARGGLQPAASFLAWSETTMLAGEALSDARADVKVADEELEARRGEWSSAAARVSALENLDERGREAHAVERRREETKTADDIITVRSGSRRPDQGDTPCPPGRWDRP